MLNSTNILITHVLAYSCYDKIKPASAHSYNAGSKSLTKRKQELISTLKCHISGHIHEAYSISTTDEVINICASILDEHYALVNNPIVVTIK